MRRSYGAYEQGLQPCQNSMLVQATSSLAMLGSPIGELVGLSL